MAIRIPNAIRRLLLEGLVVSALSTALAGCNQKTEAAAPEPRPVRTITVEKHEANAARQQKQIEALTAGLQKVSAQLEVSKTAPQTVLNNQ